MDNGSLLSLWSIFSSSFCLVHRLPIYLLYETCKEMSQFIFPERFPSNFHSMVSGWVFLPERSDDDGCGGLFILMVLGVACPVKFLFLATKQAQFSTKLSLVLVAACKHLTMVSVLLMVSQSTSERWLLPSGLRSKLLRLASSSFSLSLSVKPRPTASRFFAAP